MDFCKCKQHCTTIHKRLHSTHHNAFVFGNCSAYIYLSSLNNRTRREKRTASNNNEEIAEHFIEFEALNFTYDLLSMGVIAHRLSVRPSIVLLSSSLLLLLFLFWPFIHSSALTQTVRKLCVCLHAYVDKCVQNNFRQKKEKEKEQNWKQIDQNKRTTTRKYLYCGRKASHFPYPVCSKKIYAVVTTNELKLKCEGNARYLNQRQVSRWRE